MTRGEEVALLELFAVVDDVLTEHDALSDRKLRFGLGRISRQWKATKHALGGSPEDNAA